MYDPPPGAATSQLTLTLQAEYTVLYATASDLTELATLALNASLPSGFLAVSTSVDVESASDPELLDDGSARWTIRAERKIYQQVRFAGDPTHSGTWRIRCAIAAGGCPSIGERAKDLFDAVLVAVGSDRVVPY